MVSEDFLYEYIRNSNKFIPTLPIPFRGCGRFYDIYIEELMDWILAFYEEARAVNPNYGGENARSEEGVDFGDPNYEPHFDIYFSEDLFGDTIPDEADVASIYVPELDWYNPTPRTLNITELQDFSKLVYSIPYAPRVTEVLNEETGEYEEVEREPCTGIAQSDIRFLRLYVYDIARELVSAIDYQPPNIMRRHTAAFDEIQPEINIPRFMPSGRNLPVDIDIQAVRPYLGFVLSLYDDVEKEVTQHFTIINLIDLVNNKELNRKSYYGVYDILDMDGKKFNYTKIYYDEYNHFVFIGLEEGNNATPGVLITNTMLLPLIKLKPITEEFYKITDYRGIDWIQFLSTDATTVREAYLPDDDIDATATYDTYDTYNTNRYIYNDSSMQTASESESVENYIFNHLLLHSTRELVTDCVSNPPETQSVGGFPGVYSEGGVKGLWAIIAYPQMLMDDKLDLYCFKTLFGGESCSGGNSYLYGYDFALIGRLLNKEERGEEEEESNEELTEEEREEQEAEEQAIDDNNRPFKPKAKNEFNPWEVAVIEDEARIPIYGTIHPDPRRIHLWGYGFEGPIGCYGTQELVYSTSVAAFEYNRRIATNFNQSRKDLLIIGDPYTSKAKWKSAINNWNKSQGGTTTSDFPTTAVVTDEEKQRVEDVLLLETDFLLMFNGLAPLDPESTLEPMVWTIKNAGRAKNFARLSADVDENGAPRGDGHSVRLSIANFHDPVFITATDAYREPTGPEHTDKNYTDIPRRQRSISLRVWPRTLPCIQHLETFELDQTRSTPFSDFLKDISFYPIYGPFPAFFVSGLRSDLEIKITDSGSTPIGGGAEKTAYLDAFVNGYEVTNEFTVNGGGLKAGVDTDNDVPFGVQDDFDHSVAYNLPFSRRINDTYFTINVQNTNEWIMYMWGKDYGISTLNLRDYVEYHQADYTPPLNITARPDLLDLEVYLWTVENIPTNVTMVSNGNGGYTPKEFELQIKGISSFPHLWLTTDSSIATVRELPAEDSGGGDTNNDVATTTIITEEGTTTDDQMEEDGPKATLTVNKPGTFRVVVMDSARIPFYSYEVKASASE